LHLNPNVRKPIAEVFNNVVILNEAKRSEGSVGMKNVFFIEPLDYLPFVFLMNASYLVLTDSGGKNNAFHFFSPFRRDDQRKECAVAGQRGQEEAPVQ